MPNIKGFLWLLQKPLNSQIQGKPVFFSIKLSSLLGFNNQCDPELWTVSFLYLSWASCGGGWGVGSSGEKGEEGGGGKGGSTVVPIKNSYVEQKSFPYLSLSSLYRHHHHSEQWKMQVSHDSGI